MQDLIALRIFVMALLLASWPLGALPSESASEEPLRPYTADSPWNTRIAENPPLEPEGHIYIKAMSGKFGCDPTQYTVPVYDVTTSTKLTPVTVLKNYYDVTGNGRILTRKKLATFDAPLPDGAEPARGTDSSIVLWNRHTGDEWGFWRIERMSSGRWVARNGYHYNTRWSGVPPVGFGSRGSGLTYLAGVVLKEEIVQGRIDHAIAFGINYPSPVYVFPATLSDGQEHKPGYLPMGARLQLDPALTDADFDRWGLSPAGKVIARALQEYGMILVAGSGHPKIYVEYEGTAQWGGLLDKDTVRPIPYEAFRVLSFSHARESPSQLPKAE